MKIPEYITAQEVGRVCKELGLRDWVKLTASDVEMEEARKILAALDADGMEIDLEEFRKGLEVELEHGTRFKNANATNNHPVLTGKIVLAHFKESLDYYKRLEVAELEGDLLKAVIAKKVDKIRMLYKRLAEARLKLAKGEIEQLK
jgi:hypothetical protein